VTPTARGAALRLLLVAALAGPLVGLLAGVAISLAVPDADRVYLLGAPVAALAAAVLARRRRAGAWVTALVAAVAGIGTLALVGALLVLFALSIGPLGPAD